MAKLFKVTYRNCWDGVRYTFFDGLSEIKAKETLARKTIPSDEFNFETDWRIEPMGTQPHCPYRDGTRSAEAWIAKHGAGPAIAAS